MPNPLVQIIAAGDTKIHNYSSPDHSSKNGCSVTLPQVKGAQPLCRLRNAGRIAVCTQGAHDARL